MFVLTDSVPAHYEVSLMRRTAATCVL